MNATTPDHDPFGEPDHELAHDPDAVNVHDDAHDNGTDEPVGGELVDLSAARDRRREPPGEQPDHYEHDEDGGVQPGEWVVELPDETAAEAEVIEGEIVDPTDGPSDAELPPWRRPNTTEPVLPAWLTSRGELGAASRWLARYVGHVAAFYLARVPKYALVLAAPAPRAGCSG